MPLSEPAPREALHNRDITLRGYRREDGLFDIEAHLVDTKTYAFENTERGTLHPGDQLHGMWARMTVDETMLVVAFEAATDFSPYGICPQAAPNFSRLAGLRIGRGFVRQAAERVGGVHGCTHLRELLQPMATVAFQTMYAVRRNRPHSHEASTVRPPVLETCLAYATTSPVVKRAWPQFYTGPGEAEG